MILKFNVPETDDDGDGVTVEGGDCDDSNPNILGMNIVMVYNDCDGQTDEANTIDVLTWYIDRMAMALEKQQPQWRLVTSPLDIDNTDDCDDSSALITPSMTEVWYDGVDQNCVVPTTMMPMGWTDDRMATSNTPSCDGVDPIGNN